MTGSSPFGPPDPPSGVPPQDANPFAPSPFAPNPSPFAPAPDPSANPFLSAPPEPVVIGTATARRARAKIFLAIAVVVALVAAGLGAWAFFGSGDSPKRKPVASSSPSTPSAGSAPSVPPPVVPSPTAAGDPTPTAAPPPPPSGDVVAGLLQGISVVDELPNTPGYDRSCSPGRGCVFGPAWTDTEHTGCDTRNRVLGQQLEQVEFKPGTRDCKVVSGVLHDPYTGDDVQFGPGQTGDIQIDHVFALARAWDAGAADWPADRRVEFANDIGNLLAVSAKQNTSKSDSGPGTWMPPNAGFDCDFATLYLKSAVKWALMITRADEAAATRVCSP